MAGLKIAFGEAMETLGYALLPVLEKFATLLTTQLLPKIEAFIEANKDKLAAGFAIAADMALKLLENAIAFSDWISNNMGLVKTMAALIATMWATGKIAAFVTAIHTIIAALVLLRSTAVAAAIANAMATGGANLALGAAAIAAYSVYLLTSGGSDTSVKTKKKISPRGNSNNRDFITNPFGSAIDGLEEFTKGLNNATAAAKKSVDQLINEAAAKKNLERQKMLSGSTSLAVGQGGKLYMSGSGRNIIVNVAGSVTTEGDLVTKIADGLSRTNRRSFGSVGALLTQ
jgi:hypothetical protein